MKITKNLRVTFQLYLSRSVHFFVCSSSCVCFSSHEGAIISDVTKLVKIWIRPMQILTVKILLNANANANRGICFISRSVRSVKMIVTICYFLKSLKSVFILVQCNTSRSKNYIAHSITVVCVIVR